MSNLKNQPLRKARVLAQEGKLESAEKACRALLKKRTYDKNEIGCLLAAVLFQLGKVEDATSLANSVLDCTPQNAAWASDFGFLQLLLNDIEGAFVSLNNAISMPDADATAFNRLGCILLVKDDLDVAHEAFTEASHRDPDKAELHSNLGGVLMRLERSDEALLHYRRALRLQPSLRNAIDGENSALIALERIDEAIERMRGEIKGNPDDPAAHLKLAFTYAIADRFQEAEDQLHEAIELEPERVDFRLELSALFSRQDRYFLAQKELKKVLEVEPENPVALNRLARTQLEVNSLEEASANIKLLEELTPESPAMLISRALLKAEEKDYAAAEIDLLQALELHPGAGDAHGLLGSLLLEIGRVDEAIEHFERAAAINPGSFAALVNARVFPDDPAVLEKMEKFARNLLVPSEARAAMSFALTKVYEKHGDFDQAFEHAIRANAMINKVIDYSSVPSRRFTNRIVRSFDAKLFDKCRDIGHSNERPIFVCGMPRSGTTLTEQILCSHPDVFGGGELGILPAITRMMSSVLKTKVRYPECMRSFYERTAEHAAVYYLQKIAKLDDTAARVVDKLPHNFQHLGLISLIFPNAKIIHLQRDPRDVAISNYFTNFKMARRGMGFAFDLANIGHAINDHDRIMEHWRRELPIPIFDLNYEDLVENQEATARKLLDFVGLEWDPRVLEFYKTERSVKTASVWQVRQPIYKTSKERWRSYENHLGPLIAVLNRPNASANGTN